MLEEDTEMMLLLIQYTIFIVPTRAASQITPSIRAIIMENAHTSQPQNQHQKGRMQDDIGSPRPKRDDLSGWRADSNDTVASAMTMANRPDQLL